MKKEKLISIYVRNKDITPSSYYRVIQYSQKFNGKVSIHNIAPEKIYTAHLNAVNSSRYKRIVIGMLYYISMVFRVMFYLSLDTIKRPNYVVVSKTFCPKYTPRILLWLIKKVSTRTKLIWDFDDYIFESGEISTTQAKILEKNSKYIVVTSEFLRSKINHKFQDKVILLPTTDGDFQGFNENDLLNKRKMDFDKEIRIVWVATAGNIPNLLKVVEALDKAAEILSYKYQKKLVLVVVCNMKINKKVKYLNIINIKWTREKAKDEIFNAHIGIMPLILNEYSLGKGGFKLVQYLSTGLPVIASKVGFNEDVVTDRCGILVDDNIRIDGWIDAIIELAVSFETWSKYSFEAYERWKKEFSYDYNLEVWNNLLSS